MILQIDRSSGRPPGLARCCRVFVSYYIHDFFSRQVVSAFSSDKGLDNMEIETRRLKILALTPEQLDMLANNLSGFEDELACAYQGKGGEGCFKNIPNAKGEVEVVYGGKVFINVMAI